MFSKDSPNTIEYKYIDRELMKTLCHPLAVELFDRKQDPIGEYTEENVGLLESALHQPRQTFGGNDLYPTLSKKAAVLYYGLNKNHPFRNGNKRISVTALFTFLYINGYVLNVSDDDFVNKTLTVAKSDASAREPLLKEIEVWIESNIVARTP